VTKVSSDGLLVNFSGPAATVEKAFRTGIERYRLADGSIGQATTSQVRVPSAIAGSVTAVVGLDDLVHPRSADVRPGPISVQRTFPSARSVSFSHPAGSPNACTPAQQDAETSGGLTDDQIANAYGASGFTGQETSDKASTSPCTSCSLSWRPTWRTSTRAISAPPKQHRWPVRKAFLPAAGCRSSRLTAARFSPGRQLERRGGPRHRGCLRDRPQANIDVYEAPNTTSGGLDEYSQIVNKDVDQVVTSSWGVCEQLAQVAEPGVQEAENLLFEQAAAQGQTVLSRQETPATTSATRGGPPLRPPGRTCSRLSIPPASPTSCP